MQTARAVPGLAMRPHVATSTSARITRAHRCQAERSPLTAKSGPEADSGAGDHGMQTDSVVTAEVRATTRITTGSATLAKPDPPRAPAGGMPARRRDRRCRLGQWLLRRLTGRR